MKKIFTEDKNDPANTSFSEKLSPVFRKLSFTLLFSFLIFLGSCISTEASGRRRLSELAAHMIRHTGGEISAMMMVEPVRAEDGLAIKIAGREVAFYKYDLALPRAKKRYEHIRAHKAVYISGVRFEAEINGPFMMIDHNKNLKREEIIKAFRSFK